MTINLLKIFLLFEVLCNDVLMIQKRFQWTIYFDWGINHYFSAENIPFLQLNDEHTFHDEKDVSICLLSIYFDAKHFVSRISNVKETDAHVYVVLRIFCGVAFLCISGKLQTISSI